MNKLNIFVALAILLICCEGTSLSAKEQKKLAKKEKKERRRQARLEKFRGPEGPAGPMGPKGELGENCECNKNNFLDVIETVKGCTGMTYDLPYENQKTDYVRYRAYVPQMKETTVCAWFEINSFVGKPTLISYAVSGQDNEILVMLEATNIIQLTIKEKSVDIEVSSMEELEQMHLCISYSSIDDEAAIHINGTLENRLPLAGTAVRGGGTLIFGQEQEDTNARSLDAKQSFSGSITNLMFWPRILSDVEISDIARNCACPADYVITLALDRVELLGNANYEFPITCPNLE